MEMTKNLSLCKRPIKEIAYECGIPDSKNRCALRLLARPLLRIRYGCARYFSLQPYLLSSNIFLTDFSALALSPSSSRISGLRSRRQR